MIQAAAAPRGEKRAGRRKINIEFIEDKSRRHITFSKRKAGIMKKAYELSALTGTQVLLLVASETVIYASVLFSICLNRVVAGTCLYLCHREAAATHPKARREESYSGTACRLCYVSNGYRIYTHLLEQRYDCSPTSSAPRWLMRTSKHLGFEPILESIK